MSVSIISAASSNHVIGVHGGSLPWKRLRSDMRRFREHTLGKPIVMGRKTFDSLGRRPLHGRNNIVLTRDRCSTLAQRYAGITVMHSVEDVLRVYEQDALFVIGGEEIYRQFMPFATDVYLTMVETEVPEEQAEARFPVEALDVADWSLEAHSKHYADTYNAYNVEFLHYKRRC